MVGRGLGMVGCLGGFDDVVGDLYCFRVILVDCNNFSF